MKLPGLIVLGMLLPAAVAAQPLPDPQLSTLEIASAGRLVLRVHPDGGGPAFGAAYAEAGGSADATLTLQVLDAVGAPVVGYPAEDLWLQSLDDGLAACGAGAGLPPDHATDAAGMTTWSTPPRAGGHTNEGCIAFIVGMPLESQPPLDLYFVSPDLNGDLRVDLTDAGLFSIDLFAGYTARSDLDADGAVNIADVSIMAAAMGNRCR